MDGKSKYHDQLKKVKQKIENKLNKKYFLLKKISWWSLMLADGAQCSTDQNSYIDGANV